MTRDEALMKYGPILDNRWLNEGKHCTICEVPSPIDLLNPLTGKKTKFIYCNTDLKPLLDQAFKNVVERGLQGELKTFDGCYCVRRSRGSLDQWSAHAWALAIDLNAATNPLGGPGDLSHPLAQCFLDAGLTWGGHFPRIDPMHFSVGF